MNDLLSVTLLFFKGEPLYPIFSTIVDVNDDDTQRTTNSTTEKKIVGNKFLGRTYGTLIFKYSSNGPFTLCPLSPVFCMASHHHDRALIKSTCYAVWY